MPSSFTCLHHTHVIQCYVIGVVVRTDTQKQVLKEIKLHGQTMITIQNSLFNIIKNIYTYDHFMTTRIVTLIMNKIFL